MTVPAGLEATTRRRLLGLAGGLAAALGLPSLPGASAGRRIATIDWAAMETLLALGVTPVAATELLQFRKVAVEPPVPASVADIGLRGTPNYEALRLAAPDLILTSNYYEGQRRSLERIAPTLSLSFYEPGVAPYGRAEEAARTLGRLLGRVAEAEAVIAGVAAEIARLRAALRDVARRPVLVINIGDARHFRAFGTDSMFVDVLRRLGVESAWTSDTSYSAAAPLGIEALARLPDASVVIIPPVPVEARRALSESALWRALPMVREGRVTTLEPINHFGALPAALRFARLLSAALLGKGGGKEARHG